MNQHKHVLAIGVFDLFHIGHLRYLQYARTQGEFLSVGVTPDAISLAVKGKRSVIPEAQRLEIIRGLGWVDHAAFQPTTTEETGAAAQWIAAWGIDHVVAGGSWAGSPRWQRLIPALASYGVSVSFAPATDGISTTDIIARVRGNCREQKFPDS